jgi:hypothetical protein
MAASARGRVLNEHTAQHRARTLEAEIHKALLRQRAPLRRPALEVGR